MKTIVSIQDAVSYLPHFRSLKWGRQEGVAVWRLQSASGEELSAFEGKFAKLLNGLDLFYKKVSEKSDSLSPSHKVSKTLKEKTS